MINVVVERFIDTVECHLSESIEEQTVDIRKWN